MCQILAQSYLFWQAFLPGTSRFYNCARLRYKESDRIAAMEQGIKENRGVEISSTENEVFVKGKENYASNETVVIDTHNDHRIAMAMSAFWLMRTIEKHH